MLFSWTVLASALGLLPGAAQKYQGDCTSAGCHDGYARRAVVHGPVATGSCDACHEEADKTGHRFRFVEEGAALCEECHDEVTEDLDFLHGPVAAGECIACHNPHASDHPALLSGPERAVCVGCHTDMRDRIAGESVKHPPATETCIACHEPHGGDNRLNLKASAPELCLDCHDEIEEAMDDAAVTHDALTTGRACLACHDPHASGRKRLLAAAPMDLCLSCHDKPLESNGLKLINIKKLLEDNADHHGPIRDKDCLACHNAHGGDHFRMLVEEYPATFYAPFEEERYALCFDCHEVEMLEDAETDSLTNFRNGERNLHYLHVNRSVKGRTCRACHNVHASRKPTHLNDTVRFGAWELPLNYTKTDTGGSCQPGCHKLYRYDRKTAVVNLPEE